jgi:hypothetical protein
MSKKSVVEREKKRLLIYNKYNKLRYFLKGKIEKSSSIEEKIFYSSLIQKLPRNSSKTRAVCFLII